MWHHGACFIPLQRLKPQLALQKERRDYGGSCSRGSHNYQRVSIQLRFALFVGGNRSVLYHSHTFRADSLLCRRLASHVRRLFAARRQARKRHELISGAGNRYCRSGRHGQHRWCVRCNPGGRPGCYPLDVDHRVLGHGHELRRGCSGADDQEG